MRDSLINTCGMKMRKLLDKKSEVFAPVSYTHLDVYKRQARLHNKYPYFLCEY